MAEGSRIETSPAPVRKSLVVKRSPQEAFEIFTTGIGTWWPVTKYGLFQAEGGGARMEPRVGGRVYEVSKSGEEGHWGTILTWEPPHRFATTWHPGSDPANHTTVEVTFTAVAGGTRVDLEHRDWAKLGARAEEVRGGYDNGWGYVFGECFAKACE